MVHFNAAFIRYHRRDVSEQMIPRSKPSQPLPPPVMELSEIDVEGIVGEPFQHERYPDYVCPYLRAMAAGRRNRRRRNVARVTNTISGVDRVERVPGKFLINVATLSATAPLVLPVTTATLGPRLPFFGVIFQEHRFTDLKLVLHPGTTTGSTRVGYAVGYYKVLPVAAPVNIANLYSASVSRYLDAADTVPVRMSVPRNLLMNGLRPWYINNNPTGSEALDADQGVIVVLPNAAAVGGLNATIEVSYICEFRGATVPAVDLFPP